MCTETKQLDDNEYPPSALGSYGRLRPRNFTGRLFSCLSLLGEVRYCLRRNKAPIEKVVTTLENDKIVSYHQSLSLTDGRGATTLSS